VRDREDVAALKCAKSGVIVLDRDDHVEGHYDGMAGTNYWGVDSRSAALASTQVDDTRRAAYMAPLVMGKSVLDVGTGAGGFLDLVKEYCGSIAAVEPQIGPREILKDYGYRVEARLDDFRGRFDIITLFHVYEHVREPIEFLKAVRERLNPGGAVFVEVPHACDWLIQNCHAFSEFTLWSEHLILHTRDSLDKFSAAAGFKSHITGIQRYGLANHLYWLAEGKPGGHLIWADSSNPMLDAAYESHLASINRTDTLWAVLTKD
jgi:SAM-dependent methyltransferase